MEQYRGYRMKVTPFRSGVRYRVDVVVKIGQGNTTHDNRIERLWRELQANVTRNHRCLTLWSSCDASWRFLAMCPPIRAPTCR